MTGDRWQRLEARLRRLVPHRNELAQHKWLAWLRPWLHRSDLWCWSRRGVALGVAIGVFFGLLIPVAQMPASAAAAVLLRANLPAAAAATLVTNPVTAGPIYYGAYRLGLLTGVGDVQAVSFADEQELKDRLMAMGKPLLVGLAICATLGALASYLIIDRAWRWRVIRRRKQGRASRGISNVSKESSK